MDLRERALALVWQAVGVGALAAPNGLDELFALVERAEAWLGGGMGGPAPLVD